MAHLSDFFVSLRNVYKKSFFYKLGIWILFILLSALITFLLEYFVFTNGRFNHDYLDVEDIEIAYSGVDYDVKTDTYTVKSNLGTLALEFPESYVYKLKFFGATQENRVVNLEVVCEDAYQVRDIDLYDYFQNNEQTVVIDEVTDKISLYIRDSKDAKFQIKDLKLDYTILLNPIRMFCSFVILLLTFYTTLTLIKAISFKYERMAFLYIIIFGLLVSFLVPPRYTYDEFSHLVRAYDVSNGKLSTEPIVNGTYPKGFKELNVYDYRASDEYEELLEYYDEINGETEKIEVPTAASSYIFINYIFSGIGIFIARLLNVSAFFYPAFGRAGNILFYAVIIYFAIKKFTLNKPLMFFMATIPLMISVAASNGTGVIQNGCLFLALALLCSYLSREKKVTTPEYFGLLALFIIVIIARMPSGFFGFLALLIPNDKFESKSLRMFNKVITIIVILLAMGLVFYYTNSVGLALNNIEGVDFDEQLELVLEHPFRFIERVWKYTTSGYLNTSVLQDIGYIVYTGRLTGLYTFLASMLMIVLAFTGKPKEQVALDTFATKFSLIFTFMLTIAATEATLYLTFTPVNSYTVSGFQTRYFISTLIVPLLALQGRNFHMVFKKRTLGVFTTFTILILLMLYVGTIITKYYR